MAKTSFKDLDNAEAPKAEAETALVEIAPTNTAVVLADNQDGLSGEWDQNDIEYPRIKILAATSELVKEGDFPAGSINLSGELTLVERKQPLRVCVVACDKSWQEVVDFDAGEIPKVFDNLAEARAEGFSTEYGAANLVKPMARMVLLIEKPDGLEDEAGFFAYENGGKHYCLASATFAKTAYKGTAKAVFSYAMLSKKAINSTWWDLSSDLKSYKSNTWFAPSMKRSTPLTDDESAFLAEITG